MVTKTAVILGTHLPNTDVINEAGQHFVVTVLVVIIVVYDYSLVPKPTPFFLVFGLRWWTQCGHRGVWPIISSWFKHSMAS